METELSSYTTVWDARKRTFDNILNNLEVLRREVEDEKDEQDRKEGLDEASDHDEEEGQVTGTQTPAVKDDSRSTREQSRDSGEVDEDAKESLAKSLQENAATTTPTKTVEVSMEDEEDEDEVKLVGSENQMQVD